MRLRSSSLSSLSLHCIFFRTVCRSTVNFPFLVLPPEANGKKVIIADTDHLWGLGGDFKWAWKSFLRGLNPILMDPYQAADVLDGVPADFRSGGQKLARLRLNLGYIRAYADRIGLARMVPRTDLSSTRYCLADTGSQYLVYQPVKGSFTVQLRAGTYEAEWFDPVDGSISMEKVRCRGLGFQRLYHSLPCGGRGGAPVEKSVAGKMMCAAKQRGFFLRWVRGSVLIRSCIRQVE